MWIENRLVSKLQTTTTAIVVFPFCFVSFYFTITGDNFYFDLFSNFYPLLFSPSCICVKLVCTVSVGTQRASLQKWKKLQVYFCQSLYVRWAGWIYCGVLSQCFDLLLSNIWNISNDFFIFISFSKFKPNPFGLGLNFWLVRQTNWSAPGFFSRGADWF